jgi:UDP-3-O-[3-hydroxymyristoyl] glucosamine N-acyltransferase
MAEAMSKSLSAAVLAANEKLAINRILGDTERLSQRADALGSAGHGSLTFARSVAMISSQGDRLSGATVICPEPTSDDNWPDDVTLLICENPRLTFMRAAGLYFLPPQPGPGIHALAAIHPTAQIDPTAHIGAYCNIGADTVIGAETVIHPHVTIYDRVHIGARCQINSGTVIGADGFGYERNEKGELEKFPHLGSVLIADDVEIGANSCIDRGSIGDTIIHARARIDNLVHVAHNVQIGEDAAVIALSMLGGSAKIGAGAWIAPGAVLMNQVAVGSGGTVGLGAVVVKNVADGQTVMGAPAQDSAEFKAARAALSKLANG